MKRAAHICLWRDCPEVIFSGSYCQTHQQELERRRAAKHPEQKRESYGNRYGATWRSIRARVLRDIPVCQKCGAKATEVHHIKPVIDGGTNDPDNLQSLCKQCHSRITARRSSFTKKNDRG